MAISVKTSSSVSEGTQLVERLSIKQPLTLRGFSHSEYRMDTKIGPACGEEGFCCFIACQHFSARPLATHPAYVQAHMTYIELIENHDKRFCLKLQQAIKETEANVLCRSHDSASRSYLFTALTSKHLNTLSTLKIKQTLNLLRLQCTVI